MSVHPSPGPGPTDRSDWFAHRLDPDRNLIHWLPATRAELRTATFLTDVNLPGAVRIEAAAWEPAVRAATRRGPIHFIFHSAFCCSTLLSRALDGEGLALSLREPVLLNDVAGYQGRGASRPRVAAALNDAMQLLMQPARPPEVVLVKPSNLVNPLAPAMLELQPAARAVLLYAPLPTFLASVASKRLEGRLWVRDLWRKLLRLGCDPFGFDEEELFRHTDLQVAALGWLAQQALFTELAKRFPDRVRTLVSDVLLARPAEVLAAASTHLGLEWQTPALAAVAGGPLFTRHAKTGQAFNLGERDALHRDARHAHGEELTQVETWARLVAESARVPHGLPLPLLGI